MLRQTLSQRGHTVGGTGIPTGWPDSEPTLSLTGPACCLSAPSALLRGVLRAPALEGLGGMGV